jgi:hypothetical protein
MNPYEQVVFRVLRTIAAERRPDLPPLEAGQTLTYDLGLSSLDLARAIATLEFELRLDTDPFDRYPITSVRTVGDFCAVYQHHFTGDAVPRPRPSTDRPSGPSARPRALPNGLAKARRQVRGS